MAEGGVVDKVTEKVTGYLFERGNKWTFGFMSLALVAKLGLSIIHKSWEEGLTTLYFVGITGAIGTLVLRTKRTTEMVATGIGELKAETPGLSNSSDDPAINRVIQKVTNGEPSTGKLAAREDG